MKIQKLTYFFSLYQKRVKYEGSIIKIPVML